MATATQAALTAPVTARAYNIGGGHRVALHALLDEIAMSTDERTNTVISMCAIDNLTKGASGGAVQAANVALGLDETAGLATIGLAP